MSSLGETRVEAKSTPPSTIFSTNDRQESALPVTPGTFASDSQSNHQVVTLQFYRFFPKENTDSTRLFPWRSFSNLTLAKPQEEFTESNET